MTARAWPAPAALGATHAPARRARGVRPVTVLRGAIALMVLGNLGRIPVLWAEGKDAPILVNEFVLGGVLIASALACLQARTLRLDGVAFAALAFALVGAGSAVAGAEEYGLSGYELAFSLAYLARWLAYFGVYVAILNTARDDDAAALWTTLERTVLAVAAFGVVQAIALPNFAQLVFPERDDTMGWDRQGHRLVSTLLDPNFAGALVLLPLLVQLARLTYGDRVPRWKPLLLFAAVVLTFSRSTALALLVGGLVILAARGANRRLLTFGGAALLLTLPAVPVLVGLALQYNKFRLDESAMLRTVGWLRALTVFADNPVFGIGFNTYGFVQRHYGWQVLARDGFGVDGGLLFIAVMTGTVGLVLYTLTFYLTVRRCRALWRDATAPPAGRGTALGVAAGALALVVHGCFSNSLLLPFIMEPLWVLWGVVFLYARAHARRGMEASR